jgi:hypothetical protein
VLELLWDSCCQTCDDVIGTSDDLEHLVGWTGAPGALTQALLNAGLDDGQAGFIEMIPSPSGREVFKVHDFYDHAPEHVRRRIERDFARKKNGVSLSKVRARAGSAGGKAKAIKALTALANDSHLLANDQQTVATMPTRKESRGEERKGEKETRASTASPASLVDAWNTATTPPIPRCQGLSAKRTIAAKARLSERPLADWVAIIGRIEASAFCRGANDRGWVASFDWLMQPDVALKVLEGKYDNRPKPAEKPSETRYQTVDEIFGDVPRDR